MASSGVRVAIRFVLLKTRLGGCIKMKAAEIQNTIVTTTLVAASYHERFDSNELSGHGLTGMSALLQVGTRVKNLL